MRWSVGPILISPSWNGWRRWRSPSTPRGGGWSSAGRWRSRKARVRARWTRVAIRRQPLRVPVVGGFELAEDDVPVGSAERERSESRKLRQDGDRLDVARRHEVESVEAGRVMELATDSAFSRLRTAVLSAGAGVRMASRAPAIPVVVGIGGGLAAGGAREHDQLFAVAVWVQAPRLRKAALRWTRQTRWRPWPCRLMTEVPIVGHGFCQSAPPGALSFRSPRPAAHASGSVVGAFMFAPINDLGPPFPSRFGSPGIRWNGGRRRRCLRASSPDDERHLRQVHGEPPRPTAVPPCRWSNDTEGGWFLAFTETSTIRY